MVHLSNMDDKVTDKQLNASVDLSQAFYLQNQPVLVDLETHFATFSSKQQKIINIISTIILTCSILVMSESLTLRLLKDDLYRPLVILC